MAQSPVPTAIAAHPITHFLDHLLSKHLFQDASYYEEVEKGISGPGLGQEVVKEAKTWLAGHVVVEGVDQAHQ